MSSSVHQAAKAAATEKDPHRRQVELVKASLVCCPGKPPGPRSAFGR
jgi:hypothetical protein